MDLSGLKLKKTLSSWEAKDMRREAFRGTKFHGTSGAARLSQGCIILLKKLVFQYQIWINKNAKTAPALEESSLSPDSKENQEPLKPARSIRFYRKLHGEVSASLLPARQTVKEL